MLKTVMSTIRYYVLICLIGGYFLAELIIGIRTGSLTLQTDAFHMVSDVLAMCIGLFSVLILERKKHVKYTFGWGRAEIISGLVNSVFLLAICFIMFIESITKISHLINKNNGDENDTLEKDINLVLYTGIGGLIVNLIGIFLFGHAHDHNHEHAHEHGNLINTAVLLHIIGDALGSIAVIGSSLAIKYSDDPRKFYADPSCSILIIIVLTGGSVKIINKCVKILLHHSAEMNTETITCDLLKIKGILSIHDFHIWSMNGSYPIATLHARMKRRCNSIRLIKKIKLVLHSFDIHCSTIQPEWSVNCTEVVCEKDCREKHCCPVLQD